MRGAKRSAPKRRKAAVEYSILAHANLRHYLPGADASARVEAARPLTARALLKRLGIPEGEVMAVTVAGEPVKFDRVLGKSCAVEIFPVLAGG
ncbi:MAG: MoaD/ThiS family protein [Elusimicrobia bacterium]|nr:MoaD/ThiS family protein [Elusimicrobiota bacterium]